GSIAYCGSSLSPALLSVGYIVGLNIAVLIFLGGLINWLIAIPICAVFESWPMVDGVPKPAVEWAYELWSAKTRYIGVGAMLIGGLWTIIKLRTSVLSGIRSGLKAYGGLKDETVSITRTERDVPMKWVMVLVVASVVPLFIMYQVFVKQVSVSAPMAVTMLLTGFLFSAVAGYMAGLVGSSNNPISGVTIATVLVSALLLVLLMGKGAENGPPAAIIIGSVVCCAAAIAGDNMQDLKAGYLVQATPWKQQVMQMVGTVSAALVMAPILMLLLNAYGFKGHASAKDNPLAAPQANLMASVSQGVFHGQLPWRFVWIGAAVAVAVIVLDEYLVRRGSSFRTPVLAVAIGIYLPFELEVPIFVGGIIHYVVKKYHERKSTPKEAVEISGRRGLLLASGLITGEALMGILLAIPIVLAGNPRVLAVVEEPLGTWPGLILLVAIGYWLCRVALGKGKSQGG
ncbi:MAG: OPT family oligopeptide transporter, partial [Planctomycetota bacterium]